MRATPVNLAPFRAGHGLTAALYAGIVLIWGSTWIAMRSQVEFLAPEVALVYRFAIAAMVMMLWVGLRGGRLRFPLRTHLYLAGLGVCLFSLNMLCFYYAARSFTSGLMAVVFSTAAIMNALNAALWLGMPVSGRQLAGGLSGVAGLALVFLPEIAGLDGGAEVLAGLGLCLAGTFFFSMGNIVSARLHTLDMPLHSATAWGMVYGTGVLVLISLLRDQVFALDTRPVFIVSLFYLALVGSVLAFATYLTLLRRIGPAPVAYTTVLFPIVALLISTVVEDYRWTLTALAGLALVVAGNIIIMRRPRSG